MTNICVRCGRPMADQAYACSSCAYRAGDQLHEIADMAPAARDVAHGFARHGTGGASGKPGSRLPFDTMATEKLNKIQARLSTWVGEIAHARNRPIPAPRHLDDDPIVLWARWLAGHVEWIRKTDDAERFLIEVGECASVLRGVARGPASQRYLGPCGAIRELLPGEDYGYGANAIECPGDIYAREGAQHGACRTCGATVSTRERRAWLDGEARSHAFRASQIAQAYGINVNTIRSWASRPRPDTGEPPLASYWRTEGGLITPWVDPTLDPNLKGDELKDRLAEISDEITARGGRLHYVGDVLDLAAADAARRATEQAKRARRAATRAAESEDAA